ncbi:MAG: enoyl-CoA hydratase/isomerase family protein [Pseudomonadota bacterium]
MSASEQQNDVLTEVRGQIGMVTLNRPKALNALSLGMIRTLTATLQAWRDDPAVLAVTVRGAGKDGEAFGSFCAGGDIRFFHKAALAGDSALEDFFTEEYTLNHLIATYPKPYIAFMDGVVMGGGMGISQGASLRVVTDRTKMAMPETGIGLFPDVGGSYFLSRCPGAAGEYLALTGNTIASPDAIAWGLADGHIDAVQLPVLWETLAATPFESANAVEHWVQSRFAAKVVVRKHPLIDKIFGLPSVTDILAALDADASDWARDTAAVLRKRSPLMLHVVLEQVRRGRAMGLADCLRMERVMVYRSFHLRPGAASETVEGIRALAIDKDHQPKWNPARIEDVTPAMVNAFFDSPWTAETHPLRALG